MCPQEYTTYSNMSMTCDKILQGGMKGHVDKSIMGSEVELLNFEGWMTNLLMWNLNFPLMDRIYVCGDVNITLSDQREPPE